MSDDYAKYEADCKKIRKQNKKLLDEFALSLQKADLKEATIRKHIENIDFYINEYLLGSSGFRVISFPNERFKLISAYGNYQSSQIHKLVA